MEFVPNNNIKLMTLQLSLLSEEEFENIDRSKSVSVKQKRKLWTQEEIDYIVNNWGTMDTKDIAHELGRSLMSIYSAIDRFNIKDLVESS